MIELYNGDCIEVMNALSERNVKVDAVITDIPGPEPRVLLVKN